MRPVLKPKAKGLNSIPFNVSEAQKVALEQGVVGQLRMKGGGPDLGARKPSFCIIEGALAYLKTLWDRP